MLKNHTLQHNNPNLMSNSLELLFGSILEIQKKFEILSDIIIDIMERYMDLSYRSKTGLIDLLIYY
jgi:lysyl-tRNA synthetase class II